MREEIRARRLHELRYGSPRPRRRRARRQLARQCPLSPPTPSDNSPSPKYVSSSGEASILFPENVGFSARMVGLSTGPGPPAPYFCVSGESGREVSGVRHGMPRRIGRRGACPGNNVESLSSKSRPDLYDRTHRAGDATPPLFAPLRPRRGPGPCYYYLAVEFFPFLPLPS